MPNSCERNFLGASRASWYAKRLTSRSRLRARSLTCCDSKDSVWVEEFKDGRFGLAIQDDRSCNDWGSALQKRVPLDPDTDESVGTAATETLTFLLPPNHA